MDCKQQRKIFTIRAIAQGWTDLKDIPQEFLPEVSEAKKARWLKVVTEAGRPKFSETPKLVNRFTLGADPEFVLYNPMTETRLDGSKLGLKTGMAYGVDSNGRLLEIRPNPSRSALEVLASILVTLRWFALTQPQALSFQWRAGAYLLRDGLGGHVHLARKTPRREAEVKALDRVYHLLVQAGAYPADECADRRAGDQFGQRYGRDGDIRPQNHGYEYRTLPSWLDSPTSAFLSIALTKLVAFDPEPFLEMALNNVHIRPQIKVLNMLRKHEGMDDDARIAVAMIQRWGFPKHEGGDFRARWGLTYSELDARKQLIPSSIKPTVEECKELFCHLVNQGPLLPVVPKAYWVTKLPKGYELALDYTDTTRVKGLGEILAELVTHRVMPSEKESYGFSFAHNDDPEHHVLVAPRLWKMLPKKGIAKKFGLRVRPEPKLLFGLSFNREARENAFQPRVREFLLSGLFPIWEVKNVKEESYGLWEEHLKKQPTGQKFRTKVIKEKL